MLNVVSTLLRLWYALQKRFLIELVVIKHPFPKFGFLLRVVSLIDGSLFASHGTLTSTVYLEGNVGYRVVGYPPIADCQTTNKPYLRRPLLMPKVLRGLYQQGL